MTNLDPHFVNALVLIGGLIILVVMCLILFKEEDKK